MLKPPGLTSSGPQTQPADEQARTGKQIMGSASSSFGKEGAVQAAAALPQHGDRAPNVLSNMVNVVPVEPRLKS